MDALLGLALIAAIVCLYFFPTIVAGVRNHHNTGAIVVVIASIAGLTD